MTQINLSKFVTENLSDMRNELLLTETTQMTALVTTIKKRMEVEAHIALNSIINSHKEVSVNEKIILDPSVTAKLHGLFTESERIAQQNQDVQNAALDQFGQPGYGGRKV